MRQLSQLAVRLVEGGVKGHGKRWAARPATRQPLAGGSGNKGEDGVGEQEGDESGVTQMRKTGHTFPAQRVICFHLENRKRRSSRMKMLSTADSHSCSCKNLKQTEPSCYPTIACNNNQYL